MAEFDYLVVGAGFAGVTAARVLAEAGKRVLVVDQRDHIGGNAYDYVNEYGLLVHKYGAHIFHTNSKEVYDFLSRFTEWRPYTHKVLANVDGTLLPVPINQKTLAFFGGDLAAAIRVMYEPYTQKQWGPYAAQLSPSVLGRVTPRVDRDDRYFTDLYQAMPTQGYTSMFLRMLKHDNIVLSLKTKFEDLPAQPCETIFTGAIDQAFGYTFGRLPYRSAFFKFATFPKTQRFQSVGVVNCPDPDVRWTRIIEFKHLTGQRHSATSVAFEYPLEAGEPFWPVPTADSQALYQRYVEASKHTPWMHFCGRLGTYRYLDIHQVVAQALKLTKQLLSQEEPCRAQ